MPNELREGWGAAWGREVFLASYGTCRKWQQKNSTNGRRVSDVFLTPVGCEVTLNLAAASTRRSFPDAFCFVWKHPSATDPLLC